MKRSISSYLGTFVVFLYCLEITLAQAVAKNTATYEIIASGNGNTAVFFQLDGSNDFANKHCLIKKSNEGNNEFEDINECDGTDSTHGANKCVLPCSGMNLELNSDIFSPRTKYVLVFAGDNAEAAFKKSNEGIVFGHYESLLANPKFEISTSETKLKMSTKTCNPVACPIYYKGVNYAEGTAGANCLADNSDNEVEFDLLLTHYEMRCVNYPSFFYNLQNEYTLQNFGINEPQYYVTTKTNDAVKYLIKFTNEFPSEICLFSIKEESTAISNDVNTEDYKSKCGGTNKKCFAPCNNVELEFDASKTVVEVLIQTRHFPLKKTGTKYFGYIQKKFVVTETTANNGGLLFGISSTGVTLNVPLFTPSNNPKFVSCTVTYYAADKPKPSSIPRTNCENNANCLNTCASPLNIAELAGGKPYILEIVTTAGIDDNKIPADFKENIFFKTNNAQSKTFDDSTPILEHQTAKFQIMKDNSPITKDDITCDYYISPQGKNSYVNAMCASRECMGCNSCRNYCKESQTIIGLNPGTNYDVKVVAHKDYEPKVYSFTTKKCTLALNYTSLSTGFKVIATLSTPFPGATCQYKLEVKKGDTYELVEQCPATSSASISRKSGILIARSTIAQSTIATCTQVPSCDDITITQGYEADKEYKITVTAVGLSEEAEIIIPQRPTGPSTDNTGGPSTNIKPTGPTDSSTDVILVAVPPVIDNPAGPAGPSPGIPTGDVPLPTDPNKNIIINFKRVGTTITINPTLTSALNDQAKCKWELRNNDDSAKPIVKSCTVIDQGCSALPLCKEITIANVDNSKNYHLTVIHETDPEIFGTILIKKGDTSSGKSTIIAVVVPLVIILAGVAFYFGYWTRRN